MLGRLGRRSEEEDELTLRPEVVALDDDCPGRLAVNGVRRSLSSARGSSRDGGRPYTAVPSVCMDHNGSAVANAARLALGMVTPVGGGVGARGLANGFDGKDDPAGLLAEDRLLVALLLPADVRLLARRPMSR